MVDENFCLLEVGPGGKWRIATFWLFDIMPKSAFGWTVELCGGDNAHWAPGVGAVHDESFPGLENDFLRIQPY